MTSSILLLFLVVGSASAYGVPSGASDAVPQITLSSALDAMRSYLAADPKRAMIVAEDLEPYFRRAMDLNGDGKVSTMGELDAAWSKVQPYWEQHMSTPLIPLAEFLPLVDLDGNGEVSPFEWTELVALRPGAPEWNKCAAFGIMTAADLNQDGVISGAELAGNADKPFHRLLLRPALGLPPVPAPSAASASLGDDDGAFAAPASGQPASESLPESVLPPVGADSIPAEPLDFTASIPIRTIVEMLGNFTERNPEVVETAMQSIFPAVVPLFDTNGNGVVDVFELGSALRELKPYWPKTGLPPLVSLGQWTHDLDTEIDGKVTLPEVMEVLLKKIRSPSWDALVGFVLKRTMDLDADGMASVEEQKEFAKGVLFGLIQMLQGAIDQIDKA